MKILRLIPVFLPLLSVSCVDDELPITVANDSTVEIGPRLVEIDAKTVYSTLNVKHFNVLDDKAEPVPFQITHDSLLVFLADVKPGKTLDFTIFPCDTVPVFETTVWGNFYPKRRDDLAFENEKVGFRIYGPGTQKAGEKAYGYDLFFKYPVTELIVPQLYEAETADTVRAKVDSLRRIDNALAEEYIKTFSYHIDHGKGMDCYAVGETLGAGVAALLHDDTIEYAWCYSDAKILDNGPLRFTAELTFDPRIIDNDTIIEKRIITLDAGSYLNRCVVQFEGNKKDTWVVAGFPLRDDSPVLWNTENGTLAYADPTQGPDNGKALLGIVMDSVSCDSLVMDHHALLKTKILPGESLHYQWGFAWDKTAFGTLEAWNSYLDTRRYNYKVSINPQ